MREFVFNSLVTKFVWSSFFITGMLNAQTVVNGSITGTPVGNSSLANATGWSGCGFSPDLCDVSFPGYLANSVVPAVPSPDGGSWLGVASVGAGECAQTSITGLTSGQDYTLCFYGANFGCGLFSGLVGQPRVHVGATTQTYTINQGSYWTLYSLDFTATAATMPLQVTMEDLGLGNAYCGLDGFVVGQTTCAIMLPVEMIDFTAVSSGQSRVELSWKTLSERNSDYFIIERSRDLAVWETVGVQNGAGNSNEIVSYDMIDLSPILGNSYYRCTQFDFDGQESIAGIIAIQIRPNDVLELFASPNPTGGKVTILSTDVDVRTLELYSAFGEKMPLFISEEGTNKLGVDLSSFPQGVYILRSKEHYCRIMKQ